MTTLFKKGRTDAPYYKRPFCGGSQVVCSAHLGLVCFWAQFAGMKDRYTAAFVRTFWLNPDTYEFENVSTAPAPQWVQMCVNAGYVGADSPNMIVIREDCPVYSPDKMKVVCVMNDAFVELQTISCVVPCVGVVEKIKSRATSISVDGNRMAVLYYKGPVDGICRDLGAVVVVFERSIPSSAWLPRGDRSYLIKRAWASLMFLNGGSKLFVSETGDADGVLWDIATDAHVEIPCIAHGTCTWCGASSERAFVDRFAPYNDCCAMECRLCRLCDRSAKATTVQRLRNSDQYEGDSDMMVMMMMGCVNYVVDE